MASLGGRRTFFLRRCTDAVILRLSGVRIGPGPRITDTPVTVRPDMTIRHKAPASIDGLRPRGRFPRLAPPAPGRRILQRCEKRIEPAMPHGSAWTLRRRFRAPATCAEQQILIKESIRWRGAHVRAGFLPVAARAVRVQGRSV